MNTNPRANVLFICSRNQWRSPTAEKIYQNDPRIHVRSRGTSVSSKQRLLQKDIAWADMILVMEAKHKSFILSNFQPIINLPIHILEIPDDYHFMDEELQQHLFSTVDPILEEYFNQQHKGEK